MLMEVNLLGVNINMITKNTKTSKR